MDVIETAITEALERPRAAHPPTAAREGQEEGPGRHRRLARIALGRLRRQPVPGPRGRLLTRRVGGVTEDRPRRIVAVVVTFNRLPLLQRLVARLRETADLDEILVIDNASADGTGEWLGAQRPPGRPVLRRRTLDRNRGGAGGFHAGLSWALERGADLVWLMDDDGLPDPGCLADLLRHRGELDFWGPVVVDEADPDRLVFPIRLPGGTTVVHQMADVRAAATRRVAPRHRHPVQRGAGDPRPGRADRPGPGGVLHLGRRPRVPPPRRARRRPDRHRRRRRACGIPSVGDARHADDVRPDDVQPHAQRPQALLHGAQQPGQPARLPRPPPCGRVRRQDGVVLLLHPAEPGPGSG